MIDTDYDSIIVVGGSAGATLAARLSEDPRHRVLLLEAGVTYAARRRPSTYGSPTRCGPPQTTTSAGLRVIDASIMPEVPRANTHLTTVTLAERMAERIADRVPA